MTKTEFKGLVENFKVDYTEDWDDFSVDSVSVNSKYEIYNLYIHHDTRSGDWEIDLGTDEEEHEFTDEQEKFVIGHIENLIETHKKWMKDESDHQDHLRYEFGY